MIRDPFEYKSLSKLHPRRLWFTASARLADRNSRARYGRYQIDMLVPSSGTSCPAFMEADTAVTREQMSMLLHGLRATEALNYPLVEVGAYRGVTTQVLATNTIRPCFAIDPYSGYGGAEVDLLKMNDRIKDLPQVSHLRMTSGQAYRSGRVPHCSFVFVDAVHDYVNARFDGTVWSSILVSGGIIAFHDVDTPSFAGVQRAVWELLNERSAEFTLFAHTPGLVLLLKR